MTLCGTPARHSDGLMLSQPNKLVPHLNHGFIVKDHKDFIANMMVVEAGLLPSVHAYEVDASKLVFTQWGGMHFTPGYPISCGWLIRRPRTCCTISE